LVDVAGNNGDATPLQNGAIAVNIGVTEDVTVTDKLAVVAHCPAFGVNV
jgi:hypothetical protein